MQFYTICSVKYYYFFKQKDPIFSNNKSVINLHIDPSVFVNKIHRLFVFYISILLQISKKVEITIL